MYYNTQIYLDAERHLYAAHFISPEAIQRELVLLVQVTVFFVWPISVSIPVCYFHKELLFDVMF